MRRSVAQLVQIVFVMVHCELFGSMGIGTRLKKICFKLDLVSYRELGTGVHNIFVEWATAQYR